MSVSIQASESGSFASHGNQPVAKSESLWEKSIARIAGGCGVATLIPLTALIASLLTPEGLLFIGYKIYMGLTLFGVILGILVITSRDPSASE